MRASTPDSSLVEWATILQLALNAESAVELIVDRATQESQRRLEERERHDLGLEDRPVRVPAPVVPVDPDDVLIQANQEILQLFDELDRNAAVSLSTKL